MTRRRQHTQETRAEEQTGRRKTHRVKILGFAVFTALSMMASSAVAAHAETYSSAQIKVNGLTMTEAGIPQVEVSGTIGTGQLTVPGLGLIIHCEGGEVRRALLGSMGKGSAELGFTGCVLEDSSGTENTKCTIYSNEFEEDPGEVLVRSSYEVVKGDLNENFYIKTSAGLGEPFTTIYMVGSTCTLPEENEFTGSAAVLLPNAATESVNHTIEGITPSEEAELGVGLFWGTQEMYLDPGEGAAHLIGQFMGANWSAQ